jgi:glycerophosphoryl diester phosphodiesterase
MPVEVIETFLASKTNNPRDCEDMIFIDQNFAAVIDGVTSKRNSSELDSSTGRKAAELILETLATLPADLDGTHALRDLNQAVRTYYEEQGILQEAELYKEYRCGASVVIYSNYQREVWRVGDCGIRIGSREFQSKKTLDRLLSELRSCFLETEIRRGKTIEELQAFDPARAYLEEMLSRQVVFQNAREPSPYNFEVIDGFFWDYEKIERYPVPPRTKTLVLASDGYPVLKPTLEESEQELDRILKEDPLCFRTYKSTKGLYKGNVSFDDRAYVRIDVMG